mmetsp:Transcript_79111/g.219846  ORF Transcript_79111/g.219846 Transcript_79111/m.219846 type:complete len:262 (-) Transcript_79111:18-803(-)
MHRGGAAELGHGLADQVSEVELRAQTRLVASQHKRIERRKASTGIAQAPELTGDRHETEAHETCQQRQAPCVGQGDAKRVHIPECVTPRTQPKACNADDRDASSVPADIKAQRRSKPRADCETHRIFELAEHWDQDIREERGEPVHGRPTRDEERVPRRPLSGEALRRALQRRRGPHVIGYEQDDGEGKRATEGGHAQRAPSDLPVCDLGENNENSGNDDSQTAEKNGEGHAKAFHPEPAAKTLATRPLDFGGACFTAEAT